MNKAMLVSMTLMAATLTYCGTAYLMEDSGYLWILMVYCGGLLTGPVILAAVEG